MHTNVSSITGSCSRCHWHPLATYRYNISPDI